MNMYQYLYKQKWFGRRGWGVVEVTEYLLTYMYQITYIVIFSEDGDVNF